MTIEKHGAKWRVRHRYKGKLYLLSLDSKPSKKEAERLMWEHISSSAPLPTANVTFESAIVNYCAAKSDVLSPSTVRGYYSIKRALPDYFKCKNLADIDNIAIQTVINDYAKNHAASTVKNAYGLITAVMGMYNPNLTINCTLPMKIKKEPYIPTEEEVKALCVAARETNYWAYIMLGAYGLRRSEILAINPATDLNGNRLKICKAKVQNKDNEWVIKNTTKTPKSTREICIDDILADTLRNKGYTLKAHPSTAFQWMARTEKKLGIEHFSIHKLRHYFATVMSTLIPEKDWLYLGGWTTDYVAKTVYQHSMIARDNEQKQKAAAELAKRLYQNCTNEEKKPSE